ncbi:unnamed protein product [Rotaria magnacalcarata]|uniref:Multifunctional fusion protein n=2 Tax=Rotaria magnacalcarata TaxID=392030 RepID=A0A816Y6K6_9BILA|nr:unnamed protein product [Rotaria magnacalcarata]CAF4117791.1 unnamed protein product [Rotaria magnacalcarata]
MKISVLNMSEQNNNSTVPKPTESAVADAVTTSDAMQPRRRMVQNYLVIWVDGNINTNNESCQNSLDQLCTVVSEVNVCTTPEQCIEFLNNMDDGKVFIISSGALAQQLVFDIHSMAQVNAIYIFCGNKVRHKQWVKDWSKIQGVFTSIKPICESLKKIARHCDHDSIPMSFVPKEPLATGDESQQKNIDELEPSYMYSVLFKEIMLEINEDDEKSMKSLVTYCHEKNVSKAELDEFERQYCINLSIWWYTKESFLYGMLNKALRSLDMEFMVKIGFFIRNLHRQLEKLHQEQSSTLEKEFLVYRGQGMMQEAFQHLLDTKGGLISFNSFLSTSMQPRVAMEFVQIAMSKNEDIVGIFFIMTIDQSKISAKTTPFGMIDEYSAIPSEQEILFTMHTVFRVVDIKQTIENSRLWEVELAITGDSDPQLAALTDRIKQEITGSTGWHRLGDLMLIVGHFSQSEELYNELLQNASSDNNIAHIYNQLGMLKYHQGIYQESATFYKKSLEVLLKTLPENDVSLANTYNNIGLAYKSMGDYAEALEYYDKAREIKEKFLSPNDPNLALTYNNIGVVYKCIDENAKALEFFEKSMKIKEISLPPNHPDLATSYNNIGLVYNHMGDYKKALEFYEKDFEIMKKVLPPNHPSLATSYNNIGLVYNNMDDYSRALDYFEKSMKIKEISLPPNHPDSAASYRNIGLVYNNMSNYSKALEFYEKSLKIDEISLPPNHPELAHIYNDIGRVYNSMGDYSNALSYLEKALTIRRKNLPSTHPLIQITIDNIDCVKKKL